MKLKQVVIQNYKSCKETVVDINDGVTALIGINGAGKTVEQAFIESMIRPMGVENGAD